MALTNSKIEMWSPAQVSKIGCTCARVCQLMRDSGYGYCNHSGSSCKLIKTNQELCYYCLGNGLQRSMFDAFQTFRDDEKLCDIVISSTTGSREYHCHRLILASESRYFRTLFRLNFSDSDQKKIELDIEEPILEKLLHMLYQQSIEFEDDVVDLFYGASYLQMENILVCLQNFIVDKNALFNKTELLLKLCCAPELKSRNALFKYVQDRLNSSFLTVSQSITFFEFSLKMLTDLSVFNPKLFANAERYVNFIGKWIYYDYKVRIRQIDQIIETIDPKSEQRLSLPVMISQCEKFEDLEELKDFLKIILNGLLLIPVQKQFATIGGTTSNPAKTSSSGSVSTSSSSSVSTSSSLSSPVAGLNDLTYTKWIRRPMDVMDVEKEEIIKWKPSDEIKFTIGNGKTSPSDNSTPATE